MEEKKKFDGRHSELTGKILGHFSGFKKNWDLVFQRRFTKWRWKFYFSNWE
jgi:hypothetical protein